MQKIQSHTGQIIALLAILVAYGFTRLPHVSDQERSAMAARFAFTVSELPTVSGDPGQAVRGVHPDLEHISAWISAVGASVALRDLDGDGLPNDACYVDVRFDQVIVAPVPGTAERYVPFTLDPTPLRFDRDTVAPMGCLPGDLNEDGWSDLLVYYWGRTPIAFLRNPHQSTLTASAFVPRDIVPERRRWYTNAATRADFDGDGHADLMIGNYFPDGARILDTTATDRAYMQHSMSRAFNGGTNRVLLWQGSTRGAHPDVRYEEAKMGWIDEVAQGWTLAVGAADLNGDLLPEVYVANDFGPDRLLHNRSTPGHVRFSPLRGRKTLTTPNSKVLGHDSFKGMGVDFADLNGDGWLDIYVSNIAAEYALEESHFVYVSTGAVERMNEGRAPYIDRSEPLGLSRSDWSWESRWGDFDNDGTYEAVQATGFVKGEVDRWPELQELATGNDEFVASPRSWLRVQPGDDLSGYAHNRFFVQAESGRYFDLAPILRIDAPHVSRGIATADVDGDGDLDFAVANQWEPSVFYRNVKMHPNAFLGLHLVLPADENVSSHVIPGHPPKELKSRPAVGATARVQLPGGRRQVAQVDGGNGHSGTRSPNLHFGLGNVSEKAQIRVDVGWRDTEGTIRHEQLTLSPGWHTVVLGPTQSEGGR